MDFSNYTIEQIDALEEEVIKHLGENDYYSFLERNKELGRKYEVGGKQGFSNPGVSYYGSGSKALSKNENGEWDIGVSACGPDFEENPRVVDEETFIRTMLELGVSKEKINEFIAYEVNWDDF
jgi:hypothetical protein